MWIISRFPIRLSSPSQTTSFWPIGITTPPIRKNTNRCSDCTNLLSVKSGLLEEHVAARNTAGARELLGAIAKYASINSKNRTLCRFICYDVLVAYVSARKQCGYPITESELKGLLAFINFNQLEKELSASLDTMKNKFRRLYEPVQWTEFSVRCYTAFLLASHPPEHCEFYTGTPHRRREESILKLRVRMTRDCR